ncbi:site-2 protease family protein [Candidatus Saccharibacteria bacterium]|nr:site-2 protease family protein [Candidatus Saccharibacteria bacterium]
MNIVFGIIIGIFVLMGLIVAHELGHFIAARRNGVAVKEFGIGFPPRALAWVKGKDGKWHRLPKKDWGKPQKSLILSLNWLPIGGFCSMDGESDADTRKGTFGATTFWQKTKILFAGVTANWLVAFIILTILAFTGMPHFVDNQFTISGDTSVTPGIVTVKEVVKDSPAEKAGFKEGDQILRAAPSEDCLKDQACAEAFNIADATSVTSFNKAHPGSLVYYNILRDGAKKQLTATLGTADAGYLLGVSMSQSGQALYRSTWSAPIVGAATTVQLTGATFEGLGTLLWNLCSGIVSQASFDGDTREQGREAIGAAGDSVSGPVGIIGTIFPAFTQAGPTNVAFLAALISVSLACMNVIPIPALDGGRWLLIAIFRFRRKKLTKKTEERIVSRAFIILLALIVIITVLDITRLF